MAGVGDVEMAPRGLEGVVVDKTRLSRVDGQKGELIYCGYNIDELADLPFEDIVHLFHFGALPTAEQRNAVDEKLRSERRLPELVQDYIARAPRDEHPMAVLRTATSMLSGFLPAVDDNKREAMIDRALALTSKVASITAGIQRSRKGLPLLEPDADLGHAANFLWMMNGEKPPDVVAKTLEVCLVLHVDHGFNASTFTARVCASTESDMVSAITAAIGSLKGPLHGGANTAVMKMLLEIGEPAAVDEHIERALLEKKKVMGFGHRVYKVFDPRAKHLKRMSHEWGQRVGNVKWFDMSERIEQLMLEKKSINPNVDFYSASTYYAMGIEPEMFTPIFAVARVVGWSAHVIEQLSDNRLFRPKALYVGPVGLTVSRS